MINHNVVRCAVPSLPPSSRISRGRHVILRAPFFNLRFSTISPFSTSLKASSYRVTIPESQVLRYGKIGPVPTRVTVPASPWGRSPGLTLTSSERLQPALFLPLQPLLRAQTAAFSACLG